MTAKRRKPSAKPRISKAERIMIDEALRARKNAYAPYSKFEVGASLRAIDGQIYSGCNVENASFGATTCAERNAIAHAVSEGQREFDLLVIATGTSPAGPPCGLCRQVLAEFAPELKILLVNPDGEVIRVRLDKLIPMNFSGKYL